MNQYAIWQRTLAQQNDPLDPQRAILRQAFVEFRENTKHLVGEIAGLLPGLTVHDITHLDALWRVADVIAGPDYPLNPAEAFVLGGAFLLHDAAHVLAAYENRLLGVKASIEWKDLIAQRFEGNEPITGSDDERFALFQVLRQLHASQAHKLPKISWVAPLSDQKLYLLPHFELREFYGDLIGEIAESHHWSAHRVTEVFESRRLSAPGFIAPASWEVDALKVAFLLRTADAAHIDSQRAPWFLFALRQPQGISESHWRFQAKMGQPTRTANNELKLSSGSSFSLSDRNAWWLAYDTAKLIDRELRDANILMRDAGREQFSATGVAHVSTPTAFANEVRTTDWEPVSVEPVIRDVSKVIMNFGGAKLYGDKPELALRELIQNAADAIRASRAIGQLEPLEGNIEVALEIKDQKYWLHVTDSGVGMSRYVLTEILPDFGNSLWSSELVRTEIPGLTSGGFNPIGQFGIGFYSVFMLGSAVRVTTRRFRKASNDNSDQWILEFENRLLGRPTLRKPKPYEELRKAGTRVSVAIDEPTLKKLLNVRDDFWEIIGFPAFGQRNPQTIILKSSKSSKPSDPQKIDFGIFIASLCPTLDITVSVRINAQTPIFVIAPNDWKTIPAVALLERIGYRETEYTRLFSNNTLIDLREPTGPLVGRLNYKNRYYDKAHLTYHGIESGIFNNFTGVLLGNNNTDLARSAAIPIASLSAWEAWSKEWFNLQNNEDVSIDALTALHPLCPDRDLSIYSIDKEYLNESKVREWLAEINKIIVFVGTPSQQDSDEITESKFNDYFEESSEILFIPRENNFIQKIIAVNSIDYLMRLEKILKDIWISFQTYSDTEAVIGEADGNDIVRDVIVFTRNS